MMSGSGGFSGEWMNMSRDMWDRLLAVLGSGDPEASERAYTILLGLAPRAWEPSSHPVFNGVGGSGDGDAPGHRVPGSPASPSPKGAGR